MGSIPLRQILPPDRVDLYRSNRCIGGFSYTAIQGFVHHRRDTWQATPEQLWTRARPDHPGVDNLAAQMPTESFFVIDFELDDDSLTLMNPSTINEARGITAGRFADPWLGTGAAASSDEALVREYIVLFPLEMLPGAVISSVNPDGSVEPVSMLAAIGSGERRWLDIDGGSVSPSDSNSAFHRFFIHAGGWVPALAWGPEHALLLTADERIARLRASLPGVTGKAGVVATGGTQGAGWAVVQGSHTRRLWMTTLANFGGLEVTVVYATPTPDGTVAGVTWVGRPYPTMAEHGFWGDQYCGFHAEVPWSMLVDFHDLPVEMPILADAEVEAAPDTLPSADTALWSDDYAMVDSAYITAVDGPDSRTTIVHDFRAANIMYPGNGGISRLSPNETAVDLSPLKPRPVNVQTTATLISGETVTVQGGSDTDLLVVGAPGDEVRTTPRGAVTNLVDQIIPRS